MIENFNPRKIKSAKREAVIKIEKYAGEGVSIGYENEKVIFVRYAIPGETIKVNIYRETKDYAMAEPVDIIEASDERISPFCEYFNMCGGCDYQMISYDKQIEIKKLLVAEIFNKMAKIDVKDILQVIKSPKEFFYRNTETFKVHPKLRKIGFFRKDTKSIVDINQCKIAMNGINEALKSVKEQEDFPPHNFKVRTTNDNDTTVHWVKSKYPDKDVYETVKNKDREIKFKISKDSFFQTNNYVIPLWIDKIIDFLDSEKNERIYDLYCGIGLITLFVSFYAKETVGVEISKSSIKDANINLEINKIKTNVKFIESPVENIID
ncbi:MAG TPA: methyltransferase, partial [Spirochaetota bacterium]|nr:methyltransferase [Spirochaetota bacterium]